MTNNTTGRAELAGILTRAEERLWVDFQDAGAFDHRGNIGTGRESAVISFLRARLPSRYKIASGEVVDLAGTRSGQIDVLIYDGSVTAPLLIQDDDQVLLAAEALLATIEVKSKLTKSETEKAISGISKIRRFRPWGLDWARSRPRGAQADDGLPRYFASVLAFDSDLSAADWTYKELTRFRSACSTAEVHVEYIDRVAVLTRGLILPAEGAAVTHAEDRKVLGMWYSALLNFLSREAARRKPFPWADYESWDGRSWEHVLPEEFTAPPPVSYSKTNIGKYKAGRLKS
ncbi:hypothetical protein QFZ60_003099 [Arthrobacter sp. B2I5]|uniref:DUF6602 domain-containing protein n=1 Tax=Arthrobacter sp. B2I5 TaxID=3042266 RepID=UPI0027858D94|nr:DUF6602 domain-containing protein [Arthrobacter sp. B2I5]MDQ0826926.1 hypothetical protein [Arthrobacter sp. B2I5]